MPNYESDEYPSEEDPSPSRSSLYSGSGQRRNSKSQQEYAYNKEYTQEGNNHWDRSDEEEGIEDLGEEDALLDSAELEQLHEEAERMKGLGNKHMAAQEYTRAYNAYSAALQLSPVGPSSHVFLSNRSAALLSLKRYSAASVDARRAIALAPTFGKAHARLGQSLYFLKNFAGAVSAYEDAVKHEPDNEVTWTYLSKARSKLAREEERRKRKKMGGSKDDVMSLAEESVAVTVTNSIATDPDAKAAVVSGGLRTSSSRLHRVVEAEFDKVPLSEGDGRTTQRVANPTLTAANIDPPPMEVAMGIMGPGNPAQMKQSPKASPGTEPIKLNLLSTSTQELDENSNAKVDDDNDDAYEDGEDPDFEEALLLQQRGTTLLANKQYRAAVEEFSAALFLVPDDFNLTPQLHLGRAHALNGLQRHESAKNDAKMALSHNPELSEAHAVMARCLFYAKEFPEAVDEFQRSIELMDEGENLSVADQLYMEKATEAAKEFGGSYVGNSLSKSSTGSKKPIPKLKPPRFVSREEVMKSTTNVPPLPKAWSKQLPQSPSALLVGPEREVLFLSESMGVKLNRGPDGVVRVLSVTPVTYGSPIARKGVIAVGDVVREAAGIDLRRPITNIMWGDTVALIKLAPRPITLVFAKELSSPPLTLFGELAKAAAEANEEGMPQEYYMHSPASSAAARGEEKMEVDDEDVYYWQQTGLSPSRASGEESVAAAIFEATEKNDRPLADQTAGNAEMSVDADGNDSQSFVTDCMDEIATGEKTVLGFEVRDQCTNDRSEILQEEHDQTHRTDTEPLAECVEIGESELVTGSFSNETPFPLNEKSDAEVGAPVATAEVHDSANTVSIVESDSLFSKTLETPAPFFGGKEAVEPEILFESSSGGDGPPMKSPLLGWNSQKWLSASSKRSFRFSGSVLRLAKGRYFWSGDQYVKRTLALFSDPDLIMILRKPRNVAEVRQLLNIPKELDVGGHNNVHILAESFLVAETVIDPKTCKLRLSPLTTPSSVLTSVANVGGGTSAQNYQSSNKLDLMRCDCFELITPSDIITLCATRARRDSLSKNATDVISSESIAFLETRIWEVALSKMIYSAYGSDISENSNSETGQAWKHQVVLGSIHSYVVAGNYDLLQMALAIAKASNKSESLLTTKSDVIDSATIDALDESGCTALHYACARRANTAVGMLVGAGADCSIRTLLESKTPCHISAQYLDEKSLSIILSSSYPSRPDPNALDSKGRTPMYLAAVGGMPVGGGSDAIALGLCLSALAAWGGEILAPEDLWNESGLDPMTTPLPHPVHCISAQWREAELEVVLSHCQYRYSIEKSFCGTESYGVSLGALFHYPLHSALISLRKKIVKARQDESPFELNRVATEAPLVRTMRVLLHHGFEPNERIEFSYSSGDHAHELNEMIGFTPLQILAAAVFDLHEGKDLEEPTNESRKHTSDSTYEAIASCIEATAFLLVSSGARISIDTPPKARLNREKPSQPLCASSMSTDTNISTSNYSGLPTINRSAIKMEKDKSIVALFGGEEKLKTARNVWKQTRSVKGSGQIMFQRHMLSETIPDSFSPGGSDSNSCAICWKAFGIMINRKQTCRATQRYVCEDCSSKSVLEHGEAFRLSDGQFALAKIDSEKKIDEERRAQQEQTRLRRARIAQAQSFRYNAGSTDTKKDDLIDTAKEELFETVKKFFTGAVEEEASVQSQAEGISSTLNLTKDAFNERGERLNTLSDKSEALKNASMDFAKMAKELKQSQNGGFFW